MALFKKPDGSFVDLPDDQEKAALQRGYQPATEEQFQASKSTLRAGVEGLARGLTFGFGEDLITGFQAGQLQAEGADPFEAKSEAVRKVRQRKEENPKAAIAGELAGVLVPSVATGGGVSALAGGGAKGAALEGGLMGLGQFVSESHLEQTPLDIEKAAISVGLGALTAGGVAKGFEKLGQGVSAGLRKLGGSTLGQSLRKKSDDLLLGALGLEGNKYGDAILDLGRREGLLGPSASLSAESAAKARALADSFEGKIGALNQELEQFVPLKGNAALRNQAADYLENGLKAKFANRPAFDDALSGLQKHIDSIRKVDRDWSELWKLQSDLFKEKVGDTATGEARETLRKLMRDFVFDEAANGSPFIRPLSPVPGGFKFNGSSPVVQTPADFGAKLRATGQSARAAMALASAFEKQAEGSAVDVAGRRLASSAVGAAVGFSMGNPIAGVAAAVANDQLKKRGAFVLSNVMRGLADSKVMQVVSKGLGSRVGQLLATAPDAFGALRPAFEKAAMLGEEAVLETYLQAAGADPTGRVAATLGLSPETPEEVEGVGRKVAAMSAFSQGSLEVEAAVDAGLSSLLERGPGRPKKLKSPKQDDLLQRMEAMRELLRDPTAAYQNLPPEILQGSPALGARLVDQAVRAASFLDSKAPRDPNALMPASVRPAWKPSEAELSSWLRYAEAVENPLKVLENVSSGYFSKEHAEALKAVYPELYADMSRKMFERLSVWEGKVPFEKKLVLSQLFGLEITGVSPGQLSVMQSVYAKDKQLDAPPSKGGNRGDARQNIDAAKNEMTQAQRLESRGAGR